MTDYPRTCPHCGKSEKSVGSGSLTQWIFVCACEQSLTEPSDESVIMCGKCNRRIEERRHGSFTQWIFSENRCNCETPQPVRGISPAKDDILKTAETIERTESDEAELPVDAKKFPAERYKPLQLLGSGAAGDVYLCRDRLLKKRVAVKTLRQVTDEQLVSFQQEARATSRLTHDNIVGVLDFGATKSGAPFMVMDFVQGINLERYLEMHGAMPVNLATHLMQMLCGALLYAHEHGVYHRDLKPSNIILIESGEGQFDLRLIDFGIARVKGNTQEPTLHQGNTIVGTPAYMSPDQIGGKPFDARSEIYSFGCLFFECLTGRPPFIGETSVETIAKHVNEQPPSLSKVTGGDTAFPDWLEDLVATCLEKDPDKRFQRMSEVLSRLAAASVGDSELEHSGKVEKSFAPQKPASRLVLLVVLTLTLLSGALWFYVSQLPTSKKIAQKKEIKQRSLDAPLGLTLLPKDEQSLFMETGDGAWAKPVMPMMDADLKVLNGKPAPRLDLRNCQLDGSGLKYLKNSHVKALILELNPIKDTNLKYISDLEELEYLSLAGTNISFEGIQQIKGIRKLEYLDLRFCPEIDNVCVTYLIQWPRLKTLRIAGCAKLTADALYFLPAFKNLRVLDIRGMKISKNQFAILATLPITVLHIDKCKLSDENILELRAFKGLQLLTATETPVTANAINKLHTALPHCRIEYSKFSKDGPFEDQFTGRQNVETGADFSDFLPGDLP